MVSQKSDHNVSGTFCYKKLKHNVTWTLCYRDVMTAKKNQGYVSDRDIINEGCNDQIKNLIKDYMN
jgi:hypothetical protein